ncbi:MAG TPA: N-acetylmuramoyl-L-alanine amidase [Ignavibacteriaceae bacterium]|nr:N-acetylmuramoyl-L-alanine amidase [Ignavibacteriaceae bacterium]
MKKFLMVLFVSLFIAGCASKELIYFETPAELKSKEKKQEFINKYSKFIAGKKFFVDPGHGGKDRFSVGNLNMVTEADVNLAVALHLRNFLEEAGAIVIMSRTKDTTVDLKERSFMANRANVDLFISIHHNAPGDSLDAVTNYTSTYYHAKETDYEYEPSERNVAKYIQRDLAYAMRNSGGQGSFDGTYSDYSIYPKAGFSVLRVTDVPAVLVECGFFTNNFEERRLAVEDFNRIQAWGIFRGLCRYYSGGIPKIEEIPMTEVQSDRFIADTSFNQKGVTYSFAFLLSDSSGIDSTTIKCYFDSLTVPFTFNTKTNTLYFNVTDAAPGDHTYRVVAANKNGNYALPFHKKNIFQ